MRAPRRLAVTFSALALTGALVGCGGDDTDDPAVDNGLVDQSTTGPGQGGDITDGTQDEDLGTDPGTGEDTDLSPDGGAGTDGGS